MKALKADYCIYPTLLDAYTSYVRADDIYDKYYGWAESPSVTLEEFREKSFTDLIDRINRKPFENEAASKGTAFNALVDVLASKKNSDKIKYSISEDGKMYQVEYDGYDFFFPAEICRHYARKFADALHQSFVEGTLTTTYGNVRLYGYTDEITGFAVHDIKTTSKYQVGKYRHNWQHLVYLYCLRDMGVDVDTFIYEVTDFSSIYTELYHWHKDSFYTLRDGVEDFIRFVNDNRDLITDTKIFGNAE